MAEGKPGLLDRFSLEPQVASAMAKAERAFGQLQMLERIWPLWAGFARGPLAAHAAVTRIQARGLELEPIELLALGPQPQPSRPSKPLRLASGYLLGLASVLDAGQGQQGLDSTLVGNLLTDIDAPQFSRSNATTDWQLQQAPPGTAIWSGVVRLHAAGLPPLVAAALAMATWEREGPDHRRRHLIGLVLLCGLAVQLGLPWAAFLGLGQSLEQADYPGGLGALYDDVRDKGIWRPWLSAFIEAATDSAQQAAQVGLAVHALHTENLGLVRTWVRAPRHPLRLMDLLMSRPVVDLPTVSEELDVTQRTAGLLTAKLQDMGFLVEVTGQKRGRRYAYTPLINALWPPEDQLEE